MTVRIGLINVMKIIRRIFDILLCRLLKSLSDLGKEGNQNGLRIMWRS